METKKCTKCKEELQLTEFAWKNKSKNKLCTQCKKCHRSYSKQHYNDNLQYYLKKSIKSRKKTLERTRNFIKEHLEKHPCVDCGETDILVLEFDHIDKMEKARVTALFHYSIDTIKREIKHCEVRCCNCHRRRHIKEKGTWRSWYTRQT